MGFSKKIKIAKFTKREVENMNKFRREFGKN